MIQYNDAIYVENDNPGVCEQEAGVLKRAVIFHVYSDLFNGRNDRHFRANFSNTCLAKMS